MLGTIQTTTSISEPLYHQIIRTYLDTESVKDTAAICNVSTVKVRKVLITEGMWSSRTSVEIQHYLSIGKTTAKIAHILCTTEKAVQQYLPYSRGLYGGDNPSVSAVNSALYRERIRIAQAKTLKKKRSLAEENHWPEILEEINNQEELIMPKKPNHQEKMIFFVYTWNCSTVMAILLMQKPHALCMSVGKFVTAIQSHAIF